MKTEEVLRREGEYRAVREALGTYHVDVVAMRPAPARPPAAEGASAPARHAHPPPADGARGPDLVAQSGDETPEGASGAKPAGN